MAGRREAIKLVLELVVDGISLDGFLKWPKDKQKAYAAGKPGLDAEGLAVALQYLDAAGKRKVAKEPHLPRITPIPLLVDAKRGHSRLKAIAAKYQVPFESLRQLTTMYFEHRDSFADRWSRQQPGARAWQRSATTIHTPAKKLQSVLLAHPNALVEMLRPQSPAANTDARKTRYLKTVNRAFDDLATAMTKAKRAQQVADLLAEASHPDVRKTQDANTFILLLNRIVENTGKAKSAKALPGRSFDALAKTLVVDLGQLYDRNAPVTRSPVKFRKGFVHETLQLFRLHLNPETVRIYLEEPRKKKSKVSN